MLCVLADGENHNVGLRAALEARSGGAIRMHLNTIRGILLKFVAAGLATTRIETGETFHPKRLFALTDAGRAKLAAERATYLAETKAIATILEGK
jgi:DNA-binding PadR family transcriptional regulator